MTEYVNYVTHGDPAAECAAFLANKYPHVSRADIKRIVDEEYNDQNMYAYVVRLPPKYLQRELKYHTLKRIIDRIKLLVAGGL